MCRILYIHISGRMENEIIFRDIRAPLKIAMAD
jgi:hypothetical protein